MLMYLSQMSKKYTSKTHCVKLHVMMVVNGSYPQSFPPVVIICFLALYSEKTPRGLRPVATGAGFLPLWLFFEDI
jgi:hypothetical protein